MRAALSGPTDVDEYENEVQSRAQRTIKRGNRRGGVKINKRGGDGKNKKSQSSEKK